MKRSLFCCLFIILVSLPVNAKEYKIAIFDYDVRVDSKNSIAKYIEKALFKTGLIFSEIDHYVGYSDEFKSLSIFQNIEKSNYDLLITISSDAMIPAMNSIIKTSWLFTNVNNPRFFGIKDVNNPGKNRSGVTYYVPVIKQISFFNKIMKGKLKKLGLIFDYNAKSRRAELNEFREVASKLDMDYIIKLVKDKNELPDAAKYMIDRGVDAIIVTSSEKLYDNIDLILEMSTKKNIPIFSVNKKGVENGALSSIARDYYTMVDEDLMPMVIDVLKNGKRPGDIPVAYLKKPSIYLNLTQAKNLNIDISQDLRNIAEKIY